MAISTNGLFRSLLIPTAVSFGIGSAVSAANGQAWEADDTYTWTAYLVDYNSANQTATLKARVEGYADIENLDAFAEGDRLTLTWTGRQWAAGIRDLERDAELSAELLTLPVEFVASERDGEYIHFRVPVPEEAVAVVSEFEAGTPLTGTSPRMADDWDSGVVALRHYNDVS
jgi:hypothetical protein